MLRLFQKPIYSLGFALLAAMVPLWWVMRLSASPAATLAVELSGGEKQVILMRAGLDSSALAAAGVGSNSIAASLQGLNSYLGSNPASLSGADAAAAAARSESDRLLRLIQAGKATEQDVSQYQTQKTALATATSQQAAVLDAIFEATTANLTQEQRSTLSTIRSNSANLEVSVEFRTVNRSKADWVQLRDDLAAERMLAAHGEAPFQAGAERLAVARANGTVAAAKTALTTNLATVTSTLNAAFSGQ